MKLILAPLLALLCFSPMVHAALSSKPVHVIFVPGINTTQNLFINGPLKIKYFPYLAKKFSLEFADLKMEEIWHPLSWDILVSAQFLARHIDRAVQNEPDSKIVLVGHSKGAVEVLLTLLQNPKWIETGKINKVILMQGAFNGSYLPNIAKHLMLERDSLGYLAGLWCLEHGKPKPVLEAQFAQYPQSLVNKLSDKIYFVRSYLSVNEVPQPKRLLFKLLEKYGLNDGALLLDDQMVPNSIGHNLGILKAAHMDLVADRYYATASKEFKLKFTNDLFDQVFR